MLPCFSLRVFRWEWREDRMHHSATSTTSKIFRLQSVVPYLHMSVSFKLKKSWSHPQTLLGTWYAQSVVVEGEGRTWVSQNLAGVGPLFFSSGDWMSWVWEHLIVSVPHSLLSHSNSCALCKILDRIVCFGSNLSVPPRFLHHNFVWFNLWLFHIISIPQDITAPYCSTFLWRLIPSGLCRFCGAWHGTNYGHRQNYGKKNVQLRQAAPASDFSIIRFFPIRVQNIPEVIRTFFFFHNSWRWPLFP